MNLKLKRIRKAWRMSIKRVGALSPPRGYYGGLVRFAKLTIKRLNGKNIFIRSLGSVGRLKGQWCNFPTGSPDQINTFFTKLMHNYQFNLWGYTLSMHSCFLLLNLRKWSVGKVSPPEGNNNESESCIYSRLRQSGWLQRCRRRTRQIGTSYPICS